jgi:hypothetical protein
MSVALCVKEPSQWIRVLNLTATCDTLSFNGISLAVDRHTTQLFCRLCKIVVAIESPNKYTWDTSGYVELTGLTAERPTV